MPITTLLAILLLVLLYIVLSNKFPIFSDRLARFWSKPKYPTKHDIAKKYPKSKALQQQSLERKRREAREKHRLEAVKKQAIIDRHINQIRANNLGEIKNHDNWHGGSREPIKQSGVSPAKFKQLVKMVNDEDSIAHRLIESNLRLFPDKSHDWACEKAIADLERIRRIQPK